MPINRRFYYKHTLRSSICFQMVINRMPHIFHSSQVTFLPSVLPTFLFLPNVCLSLSLWCPCQFSGTFLSSNKFQNNQKKIPVSHSRYSMKLFRPSAVRLKNDPCIKSLVIRQTESVMKSCCGDVCKISLVTHRVCGHFLCSQRVSVFTPSAKRSHTRSPCTSFPFLSAVLHQFLQHWVKFRDAAATQSDDLTAGMTDDWNMRWCKSDAHVPMRPYPLPSPIDMVL